VVSAPLPLVVGVRVNACLGLSAYFQAAKGKEAPPADLPRSSSKFDQTKRRGFLMWIPAWMSWSLRNSDGLLME